MLGSLSKVSHVYFNFPSLSEFGKVKLHQNFLFWSWPLQIKLDDESVWNIWSEINIDIISSPALSPGFIYPLSLSLSMHFLTPLSIFDGIVPAGLESGARLKLQRSLIFFLLCFTRIVLLLACQPPRVYKKILYSSSNLIGNLKEFLRVDFQKYRLEQSLLISQIKVKIFVTFQTTAIPYLMQDSFFCKLIINIVMHIFCTK